MSKEYVLNPTTGKIHIMNYCHLTSPCPKEWLKFDTEEDAKIEYGSQSAGICKNCLKERERRIKSKNL